jgi:hypothetical protein
MPVRRNTACRKQATGSRGTLAAAEMSRQKKS